MKAVIGYMKGLLIDQEWIIVFLLAFPLLNDSFPTLYYFNFWTFDFLRIPVLLFLICLFCRYKKKPSALFVVLCLLEVVLILSTLLNYEISETEVIIKAFYQVVRSLSAALLIEAYIDKKEILIKGLMLNFEVALYSYAFMILFHLISIDYYSRGVLNTLALWIIPAVCIACLHMLINRSYLRSCLLLMISSIIAVKVWSATIIVALLGMLASGMLGLFLLKHHIDLKLPILLFAVSVFVNLFILFIYSGGRFGLIDLFIEGFLGKSTNFTERTVIWNEAMRMIGNKPLLGNGYRPVLEVANSFSQEFDHSHNQLLQVANETGSIGMMIFMIFHLMIVLRTDRCRDCLERIVLMACFFGITITYISEAYRKFFIFYLIFFLFYHADKIQNDAIKENE